ncbi:tripartite tricarboxylate transporter TctB family protein [Marivita hallyeonensis]|uniref:Tripartite tricarboxylate transporter TctB family protein n=1 Tax=Marivita hallyeonensis TaxID=996342 RepID=A0A1M5Y3B5_9RHOB|nr:tripartite tricarboxylate transporter TctB family protein [Marivita hallyeonensis]SHI06298.1 Tripartite tricarboxylate transporter TctB family protein [Marivita hallyeonensis]
MPMNRILNERVFVLLGLFLVGAGLYASTFQQTFTAGVAAQSPVFFPRIILTLWMGLALIALVQTMQRTEANAPVASWSRLGLLIVASVIYTNVIGREGFFIPSVIFAAISLPIFGVRNPLLVALYAIAVPGALVLFFNHMLSMPLPVSRFTHLF